MPALILGTVETRNFTFTAVGADREEVHAFLLAGFAAHLDQYGGGDPELMAGAIADGEVAYTPIVRGECRRDLEPLWNAPAEGLCWVGWEEPTAEHIRDDDDALGLPLCGADTGTISDDPRMTYTCADCLTELTTRY